MPTSSARPSTALGDTDAPTQTEGAGRCALVVGRAIDKSVTMRLEITRRAELAVRAMVTLGDAAGRLKAPALADALGTTSGFVPQVVGPLVKAGWVRSDPGPTGGYASCVDLRQVSVLQVIEAVEGATDGGRCVVADRACDGLAPCSLHVAWTQARHELVEVLGGTSLSEIAMGATS